MRRDYWLIAGLALLFFLPCLGSVHLFDWDEINFAECAREMLLTGDWFRPQVDFEPFWEKPPLFFWFQAASMSIFGVGEFAARLPNALCGVATLLLVYRIGTNIRAVECVCGCNIIVEAVICAVVVCELNKERANNEKSIFCFMKWGL